MTGGPGGPIATASTSRAIVSRGHGQVPNASMDARSMSTTIHLQVGWCGTQPLVAGGMDHSIAASAGGPFSIAARCSALTARARRRCWSDRDRQSFRKFLCAARRLRQSWSRQAHPFRAPNRI